MLADRLQSTEIIAVASPSRPTTSTGLALDPLKAGDKVFSLVATEGFGVSLSARKGDSVHHSDGTS